MIQKVWIVNGIFANHGSNLHRIKFSTISTSASNDNLSEENRETGDNISWTILFFFLLRPVFIVPSFSAAFLFPLFLLLFCGFFRPRPAVCLFSAAKHKKWLRSSMVGLWCNW